MDNTSATIISFILLTFFFSILRFVLAGTTGEYIFTIIYFMLVFMMQYFVNTANLQDRCGNIPHGTAIYFTIIPWLFIFMLLYVCLIIFPGWKGPFSNTFGYAFASIMGVKSLLVDDILEEPDILKRGKDKQLLEVREDIYKSPELLINEITPENFEKFWKKLSPLFKSTADEHKQSLLKIVHIKDIVAEFIWFVLVGSFTISVSYNSISNVECQKTASELESERDDKLRENTFGGEDNSNRKVYVEDE